MGRPGSEPGVQWQEDCFAVTHNERIRDVLVEWRHALMEPFLAAGSGGQGSPV